MATKRQQQQAKPKSLKRAVPEEIPPSGYLTTVWQHLTEELCEEVFQATRSKERMKKWSLYALNIRR